MLSFAYVVWVFADTSMTYASQAGVGTLGGGGGAGGMGGGLGGAAPQPPLGLTGAGPQQACQGDQWGSPAPPSYSSTVHAAGNGAPQFGPPNTACLQLGPALNQPTPPSSHSELNTPPGGLPQLPGVGPGGLGGHTDLTSLTPQSIVSETSSSVQMPGRTSTASSACLLFAPY